MIEIGVTRTVDKDNDLDVSTLLHAVIFSVRDGAWPNLLAA